ncbi:TPA: ABC transporter ATP-binding protein [Streptococcus agalactiae]
MLVCNHVGKTFGRQEVLKDCHFHLKRGEIIGIMGKSGSGKSSLARLIIGLDSPTCGSIHFQGKNYTPKDGKAQIILVFQDALSSVNPYFSIEEILNEAFYGKKTTFELCQILEAVGLDGTYLKYKARQLSGGQLHRVCIARALLLKPKIIIFDESLSGLDPVTQIKMLRLLQKIKRCYELSFIMISHDPKICQAICNLVFLIKNGYLVEDNEFLKRACSTNCLTNL